MKSMLTRTAVLAAIAVVGAGAVQASAAPSLDSLRLPKKITAQQGHARFLAGVRISEPAKLTVQVVRAKDSSVVQTTTDSTAREKGRAYIRVEGVDDRGYQLPTGVYRLRVQATNDAGETANQLERSFRLTLSAAHGRFDAYTVPLLKSYRKKERVAASVKGQYVAVVGPKGAVATAGLRRGDVITSIGGTSVESPGVMETIIRGLPADKPVMVTYVRRGETRQGRVTPKPDWEPAPDYAASLAVATRREPKSLALAGARVRQLADDNKTAQAMTLLDGWSKGWRKSAVGEQLHGELLASQEKWKQALGAYNRSAKKDTTIAQTQLGRAIAMIEMDKAPAAVRALNLAEKLDPDDAEIAGYQAYAYLRAERSADAITAGRRAVGLDRYYADGYLPLGIALLDQEQRKPGVQALRRGLILLEDADRAARLISTYLNPTDP